MLGLLALCKTIKVALFVMQELSKGDLHIEFTILFAGETEQTKTRDVRG